MRHLHTIVCVAFVLALCLSGQTFSQEAEPSSDRFTNRELLELPVADQRLWLNALVVGFAYGVAVEDQDTGVCILDWYFEDQEQSLADLRDQMARFPNHLPTVVLIALARRTCNRLEQTR